VNLAQVIRRALFQCNVVRQDGTTPALLTQAELVGAAQDCMNELTALLRELDANWGLQVRTSDDAAFTFEGETYAPITSLTLAASTRSYTLPPDFLSMKRIKSLTTENQYIRFEQMDVDNPVFHAIEQYEDLTTGNTVPDVFYYSVIGRRTLRFANFPGAVIDIEIMYEARYPTLFVYDGETSNVASLANADATVTTSGGTASSFLNSGLSTPCAIYFNSTGGNGHPVILSGSAADNFISVQPRRVGATGIAGPWPIDSFTSNTELELAQTWPFTTDSSIGYLLCSSPEIMETHHQLFVDYLRMYIYEKIGSDRRAQAAQQRYERGKLQMKADMQQRATDPEFVEDFESEDYQ
jgi:hypothetical protein